jgi:hypothetical protein
MAISITNFQICLSAVYADFAEISMPQIKTPQPSNPNVVDFEGLPGQFLLEFRMGDLNDAFHPFPVGLAAEGSYSHIGYHIIHVVSGSRHRGPVPENRKDP